LRLYAERHARGSVETRDLARALEEATGRNLDGFLHQWVDHAGHPELECSWEWDADAARALADKPDPLSTAALRTALETDAFWGVRVAAATALGKSRRQDALDALLAARSQEHGKVRRTVAAALGEFRVDFDPGNVRAAELLEAWVTQGDPSCFVEANAALALGRVRSRRAVEVLTPVLARRSYGDTIRARALEGLGASGDEAAYPVLAGAITRAASFQSRRAAVTSLGRLAEGTTRARDARERLEACLSDSDFRVRMDAAVALVEIGDVRAIPAIERACAAELDGRAKRRFKRAVTQLREKGSAGEKVKKLGEEVERLRAESSRLRERLEKLEAPARPTTTETPPTPAATPAKRPRPGTHRSGRKTVVPRRR